MAGAAPMAYSFPVERTKPIRIGRSSDNDIIIDCPSISNRHAEIRHVGTDYDLCDLGSTNGIKHNGARATVVRLPASGSITLGHVQLGFSVSEGSSAVVSNVDAPSPVEHPISHKPTDGPRRPRKKRARHDEGMGRLGFFVAFLVVMILAIKFGDLFGTMPSLFVGAMVLPVAYSRINNIGSNPKWAFLSLIPGLGLLIFVPCLLLPPGYADEKRLDLAAKIILGVAAALLIAALAGAFRGRNF